MVEPKTSDVVTLLEGAVRRLHILADPTDGRCGCDGLAREEIRLYVQSWITPRINDALALIEGQEMTSEEEYTLRLRLHDHCVPRRDDGSEIHQNPFSPLRALHKKDETPKKVPSKIRQHLNTSTVLHFTDSEED